MNTKHGKMYEYKNKRNGGRERVYLEDEKFFINSDWGHGFCGKIQVSRNDMRMAMEFTKAPANIVKEILG